MAEERAHAEARPDSLYKTDEEIARLVGVGVDKWRVNAKLLEQEGLPRRDPLFCDRRYWPSVKSFLDLRNGIRAGSQPITRTWREHFDEPTPRARPTEKV